MEINGPDLALFGNLQRDRLVNKVNKMQNSFCCNAFCSNAGMREELMSIQRDLTNLIATVDAIEAQLPEPA
jgi:hypothetical protein